jgi:hypothetical protein
MPVKETDWLKLVALVDRGNRISVKLGFCAPWMSGGYVEAERSTGVKLAYTKYWLLAPLKVLLLHENKRPVFA